jgi:hypothetical protein
MSFPSNPNNGDSFIRFGRSYVYNTAKNKWAPAPQVSNTALTSLSTNILPAISGDVDIGSADKRIQDVYLESDSTIYIGDREVSSDSFLKYITMNQAGTITAPFTGIARSYPPININITSIAASVGTTPTADLVFDVLKNGVSVGTYTITAGEYKLSPASVSVSIQTTDYLSININSGTGATDLKVDFTYTAA